MGQSGRVSKFVLLLLVLKKKTASVHEFISAEKNKLCQKRKTNYFRYSEKVNWSQKFTAEKKGTYQHSKS